jgi:hypothetical protein
MNRGEGRMKTFLGAKVSGTYVSRLPFGGLEAEISIVEKTMVTMER